MIIDCDDCAMRNLACGDCVVTALLGGVPDQLPVEFDATEQQAMASLAGAGLVPPLRMVPMSRRGPRTTSRSSDVRSTDMTESA